MYEEGGAFESVQMPTGGRGESKFRVFIAYVLSGWPLRAKCQSVVLKEGIFEHLRKKLLLVGE